MLENELREENHKETRGFVSRSLDSHLSESYVSVDELVQDTSHFQLLLNKTILFRPLSSFLLSNSFPGRGKITALTNLPLLTTHLGSYLTTPSRLGGKPPKVTNASMTCRRESKCSSYGRIFLSSQRIS
jgi:hypothetical protein